MNCPNCGRKLTIPEAAQSRCPHCGRPFNRSLLGLVRTSAIRISAGDSDRIFGSVQDLPPDVREQLHQVMSGPNAETLIIADERGREQIFQAITSLPPDVQKRVLAAIRITPSETPAWSRLGVRWRVRILLALVVPVLLFLVWLWCR